MAHNLHLTILADLDADVLEAECLGSPGLLCRLFCSPSTSKPAAGGITELCGKAMVAILSMFVVKEVECSRKSFVKVLPLHRMQDSAKETRRAFAAIILKFPKDQVMNALDTDDVRANSVGNGNWNSQRHLRVEKPRADG